MKVLFDLLEPVIAAGEKVLIFTQVWVGAETHFACF